MKTYLTTKELMKDGNVSRSTIIRLTKELNQTKDNWDIIYIKRGKRGMNLFHKTLLNRFLPTWCLEKLNEYEEHFSDMRNLIAVLQNSDSLPYRLYQLRWDNFITIAYKETYSANKCFSIMSELADIIEEKCGKDIEFRFFFTTERFSHREGCHNHFFLRIGNHKIRNYAIDLIKDRFSKDRIDIRPYDEEKAGLFYISKNNNLKNTDWDLRGNQLGTPQ